MNTQWNHSINATDQLESKSYTFGCSPVNTEAKGISRSPWLLTKVMKAVIVTSTHKKCWLAESSGGVTKGSPDMFWGMKRLDLKLFDDNFLTTGSTVRGIPSDRWDSAGAAQVMESNDPCKGKSLSSSVGRIAAKATRKKTTLSKLWQSYIPLLVKNNLFQVSFFYFPQIFNS